MQIQKKLVKGKSISEISEELEEEEDVIAQNDPRDGRREGSGQRRTIENTYLGLSGINR